MFKFRKYKEGDTCPECGKRKLVAITGHSLLTFGLPAPWLICGGHPRCGFATMRIARKPVTANDNPSALVRPF